MLCMVHALLAMKDPGKIRSIICSLLTFIAVTVIKKSMESILPNVRKYISTYDQQK